MNAPHESRRAQPIIPWLLALIRGGVEQPGSRKQRVWPRALVGTSMLAASVWLGATVYPLAVPEPRWTGADLPSLPAASDNGWHAVASEALEIEIPKSLGLLIGSRELDSDRFWAQVDGEVLRGFLASEGAREGLARIEDARREVAFADACAPEAKTCPVFAWHQAHDVALLQALALTQAGRSTEALTLVRDLVGMSAGQLESARSPLSLIVALDQLGDALHEAEMIAARIDHSAADAQLRAAQAELLAAVSAVEVDALDLRALVILTYVHYREALELTRDRWFYSHAATVRRVDAMFERRYQAAVDGDLFVALGGGERSPTQALGWWLHNPGGKLVLDTMAFDPTSLVEDLEQAREDIRSGRARLIARAR